MYVPGVVSSSEVVGRPIAHGSKWCGAGVHCSHDRGTVPSTPGAPSMIGASG
jgi:hypothetical protein